LEINLNARELYPSGSRSSPPFPTNLSAGVATR
jgi:hypothetical protein